MNKIGVGMVLRVLFRDLKLSPGSFFGAASSGFPGSYQPRRTTVVAPQTWYFLDTEGNLHHTERRKRHFNPKNLVEEGPGKFSLENVEKLLHDLQGDLPMKGMPDPYKKAKQKCILCKYDVDVDYKNVRLLSQFVSRWTGKVYDRQTTGLCRYQSERVWKAVKNARMSGYMPVLYTEPIFYQDPKLFDPFRPTRKS